MGGALEMQELSSPQGLSYQPLRPNVGLYLFNDQAANGVACTK
jgi:hypothetical protein